MLSFQEKLAIADSFPELQRKEVSLGRVNYHCEQSASDKKTAVYHLHPNGNGFVYVGNSRDYDSDSKGFVNIREFTADQLKHIITLSIGLLTKRGAGKSAKADLAQEERWVNEKDQSLTLTYEKEDQMWYTYAGTNLDAAFETYEEAKEYLEEEGFSRT